MSEERSKELLRRLSLAAGPPGAEDEVRDAVRETLEGVGELSYDKLGSLICERRGRAASPRVVVDCHLDEVALMVQSISEAGMISFVPLGGWWEHVLLAQRVDVIAARGRIPGVIGSTPPHFLPPAERNNLVKIESMYIDVGTSSREGVEELGVRIGDPIVPVAQFREMAVDGVVSGKALDNRAGVGLMCETMLALADVEHPNTVVGVAAAQEEVGMRGAGTSSELSRPDVAIVLECSPADDLPGRSDRQAVLGGGPQVRLFDPTAISNRRLTRHVEEVAAEQAIGIQIAVRRSGGTDAGAIHRVREGVPTVVVAVPARYIHSHVSLLCWEDYFAARRLVSALVAGLDADRVRGFTRFG